MSSSIVTLLDELGFAEAAQRGDVRRPEVLTRLAALRDPDGVAARLHRAASARPSRRNPPPPALNPSEAPIRHGFGECDGAAWQFAGVLQARFKLQLVRDALVDPDADPGTQLAITRWCEPRHVGPKKPGNQLRALRRLAPPRPGHALRALRLLTPKLEALGAAQLEEAEALLARASAPEARAVLGDERPERFVASVIATRGWWWDEIRAAAGLYADSCMSAHPGHDYADDPMPWMHLASPPFEEQLAHLVADGSLDPALAALLAGLVAPPGRRRLLRPDATHATSA